MNREDTRVGRSPPAAGRAGALRAEPPEVASQAKPLVPNAGEWIYTQGHVPSVRYGTIVWMLGRYGDVYGPMPFEMIDEEAWRGNMGGAAHDLVAYAPCPADWRALFPHQPRDPAVYGIRADGAPAGFDPSHVGNCEGCGAPLFSGDDFATDENGVYGCWPVVTDDPFSADSPCYAHRVGKASASAMSAGTAETPQAAQGRSPASAVGSEADETPNPKSPETGGVDG
jgi:hypothetical protein